MRVTMLLADAAQVAGGKLYVLGGGWSVTGPRPCAMAVALKIDVPWDQANRRHDFHLELVDADGRAVELGADDAKQAVQVAGAFEAGRPAGAVPGSALDVALAINLPPIGLPPGRRFSWRLSIDGETAEGWYLDFTTRRDT